MTAIAATEEMRDGGRMFAAKSEKIGIEPFRSLVGAK
jgi:hypothetical protein